MREMPMKNETGAGRLGPQLPGERRVLTVAAVARDVITA